MNGELLAILEQMEREKGIKKDVLIKAVEAAIASAVKKVLDVKPGVNVRAELSSATGKIKAYAGDEEITSIDMGRIAAQTAKQVIIQKIREAEKDVVYEEFSGKVGEIVSGGVYRFERGNIIVDLLGKAEGMLPKNERSPKEEFKQGDRIRAYVLEVRKEARGPHILLTRAHPNFVKKMFEMEVPEIYDNIVEVKAISRKPGERTKIAVHSKDEKVDSVGACVGMRGSRVKNIVSELHGEKIDIVRYSDDTREYIKNALAPAKITEIRLDKDSQRAEVVVEDDQLSLAIGKHGQNVRLASGLVGWELDIRTKSQLEAKAEEKKRAEVEEAAPSEPQEEGSLRALSGVGEKTVEELKKAGFTSLASIADTDIAGLTRVKGIGEKKAKKMIAEAKKALKK
ncbi:MAG: transcription termination factor NusA [Candidatus Omnitrophica bacterium]|nr:transcription termination factor NusA [Candidatus Omnitrophota bacterium]